MLPMSLVDPVDVEEEELVTVGSVNVFCGVRSKSVPPMVGEMLEVVCSGSGLPGRG